MRDAKRGTSSGVGQSLLKMRQFVRIIIIQSCTIKHELQIFDAVNIVMLDYDCRKRIIQALYAWASSVKRKLQIGKGSSFFHFCYGRALCRKHSKLDDFEIR